MPLNYERAYYENPKLWELDVYAIPEEIERTRFATQWIPKEVESILDVGCGNGILVNQLNNFKLVVGLDRSRAALHRVQTLRCQGNANSLPFESNTFDIVTALEVIEHLPATIFKPTLAEMARIARRYILIAVPYRERLDDKQVACPACGCQFHAHLHMRSFDLSDMENLLSGWSSFTLERVSGIVARKTPVFSREWKTIRRKVFPEQSKFLWNFVCPQCGYSSVHTPFKQGTEKSRHSWLSWIKMLWPKTVTYGWWLALYAKNK